MQEAFYQARKKLGDESLNLPAGTIGPMINDEFADVTFALFALKAKVNPSGSWYVMPKPCASNFCTYPA